ncbi:SLC13 family permease [Legionella spiritensis]|uniref:Putative transporter n=2 Tax=Legionella spiritensis TaxID=452 RepID=A0A0W0YY13_LEGSP|nr:SLC13 family permease [Legionella spiritensis]KTD61751.1 putative transporter [Legionella spiritensis]SNV38607.1 putative transporter [Legionella spiritensis]
MDYDQILMLSILIVALFFFITGFLRYDVVATMTLLLSVFLGLVPVKHTFIGFSHSAVIMVAAVFIISRAVENTGLLDEMANYLRLRRKNIPKQIFVLCSMVVLISAFINNVGAVALMIPVALKIARIKNIPRRALLMPLSFSSLLGGLITLIGTTPNIIVSEYRRTVSGSPFHFLDFTPVGLSVAVVGLVFMSLVGWRLIHLQKVGDKKKYVEEFTLELEVKSDSPLIHTKIIRMMKEYEGRANLLAILRDGEVIRENLGYYVVKTGDVFILETDKWTAGELMNQYNLINEPKSSKISHNYFLSEITLLPQSFLCSKPIKELNLIETYGIEVIAISRRNARFTESLREIILKPGDAILIKSEQKITQDRLYDLNSIIFEEKYVRSFSKSGTIKVMTFFGLAIAAVISDLLRPDVAFFTAAAAMVLTGCISLDRAYQSVNLPIIVLIGTLIPIGEAMESTGTAKLIAQGIHYFGQSLPIGLNLYLLIVTCMLFANFINTSIVALIFSPIAIMVASDWAASPDPFLMAIAVGSSCTFLIPVGHQSNTLVIGPGNYLFSDFWRMGLPLTVLLSIVATLLIMFFWPFY